MMFYKVSKENMCLYNIMKTSSFIFIIFSLCFSAGNPVRIANKNFIDHVFTSALEVALCFDLPMQIHTGYVRMSTITLSDNLL